MNRASLTFSLYFFREQSRDFLITILTIFCIMSSSNQCQVTDLIFKVPFELYFIYSFVLYIINPFLKIAEEPQLQKL